MSEFNYPLKLFPNRVWRTYTGGRMLEQWLGHDSVADGSLPEEWVASVTIANNPARENIKNEGLSAVETRDGRKIPLDQYIGQNPQRLLGNAHVVKYGINTAVLVKMLDSAERLSIQVHPDDETALRLFNSRFGKTEAWYIINKREDTVEQPYILLGFKPGITRERWLKLFEAQATEGMIAAMHKLPVESGQMILIKGGIPHAIGPGCFILEIQQPTDYTIRVEKTTPKGYKIPDNLCHQGIGFEKMFECFSYVPFERDDILHQFYINPRMIRNAREYCEKELIGYECTPHFRLVSAEISGGYPLEESQAYSCLVILSGCGELFWEDGSRQIKQGETYFLPACVNGAFIRSTADKPITVIRCHPPQ